MLDILTSSNRPQMEKGTVVENLLDGRFRVNSGGRIITSVNQSGLHLSVGSVVSIAKVNSGYLIVSAAGKTSISTATTIIKG